MIRECPHCGKEVNVIERWGELWCSNCKGNVNEPPLVEKEHSVMTKEEYKNRANKLTSAIAQWIHKKNPSSEKVSIVMNKAQNTINNWYDQIEQE